MQQQLTISEVLSRAANLIEPEGMWTRGHLALDSEGRVTLPEEGDAVCFCGYGAIIRVSGGETGDTNPPAWDFLDQVVGEAFPNWQDDLSRDQAEVVGKLREASALAKEQGK